VHEWLAGAEEDLRAAAGILGLEDPPLTSTSFHAQQAAEKAIKAMLTRFEVPVDKTHDLGALLASAESVSRGIGTLLAGVEVLTPFAVSGRYPGGPKPLAEAAARHVALARRTTEVVRAALQTYLDSEPSAT